ncbi:hypothetical protein [Agriterribacter sp.]|uniref:hypothetical protein n=1 Tax=Agriterribacter sp. TaxID=2821509 RepID=UPI002C012682|nr:hypothetical protein [Agriterribacter sp.]HTN08353.1 hypothetical protein [Agriterribacter sp.]
MEQLVEVFKTNVELETQAAKLLEALVDYFPAYKINFDLDDCDNILRVESPNGIIDNSRIMEAIGDFGYTIEELPD